MSIVRTCLQLLLKLAHNVFESLGINVKIIFESFQLQLEFQRQGVELYLVVGRDCAERHQAVGGSDGVHDELLERMRSEGKDDGMQR